MSSLNPHAGDTGADSCGPAEHMAAAAAPAAAVCVLASEWVDTVESLMVRASGHVRAAGGLFVRLIQTAMQALYIHVWIGWWRVVFYWYV